MISVIRLLIVIVVEVVAVFNKDELLVTIMMTRD